MITINTVSATKFSFNGITYHKNFMPFVTGNKINIINAYDGCIHLTDAPANFSEYTVNGSTFASVAGLQAALLDVIYTRNSLGGGGGSSGIGGSGTVGFIPRFDTESSVTDSILSQIGNAINLNSSLGTHAAFGIVDPGTDNGAYIGSTINNDFLIRVNNTEALRIDTALRLKIANIQNAITDTDKFLVSDGGIVKYRTGAEVLTDLDVHSVPSGGTEGQILAKIDATNYNTEWIDNFTTDVRQNVKAAEILTKGQAVYISGADGNNKLVSKASNASEGTSTKTLGLIAQDLAVNGQGYVITEGSLTGLNTSTATIGDPVWLGVNGGLLYGLANKPYAPAHMVFIGIVTRVSATVGEIFVKVQNGFELNEIHDVDLKTTLPTAGDLLQYQASGLWVNKTVASLGLVPQSRQLTINGTAFDLSANRAWSVGTVTSVAGTGTVSGLTLTGTVTGAGSLTLGGTLSLTSGQITTGLGFTPYNATNPAGYITQAQARTSLSYTPGSAAYNSSTGVFTIPTNTAHLTNGSGFITLAQARSGLSFTAGSGAYNSSTGVITIPTDNNQIGNGAGYVTGTGTTNYLAKFTASGAVGNSVVYESGVNVGIGTTSPVYKTQIVSSGNALLQLNGNNTAGTLDTGFTFSADDSKNIYLFQRENAATIFGTNNTERMRITSGGNVLIGTTTSNGAKLQVEGSGYFGGNVGIGTASPESGWKLDVSGIATLGGTAGNGRLYVSTDGTTNGYTYLQARNLTGNTPLRFFSSLNVFDANVLIGTTTSNGAKLQVEGAATFSSSVTATKAILGGSSATSSVANLEVFGSTQFSTNNGQIRINDSTTTSKTLSIGVDGTNNVAFLQSFQDGVAYRSLILNGLGGNVGIGTTSPSEKLQVNGNVLASGFFQSSDERLKNIIAIDGDMITYKWKDGRDDKLHYGYSAQQTQKINSNLVSKGADNMLAINYTETLVLKVRELEKQVELLKAQIN